MPDTPIRVRYAPSPTGAPHVGNFRTALLSWLFARHHDGGVVLRIEDTDRARFVAGAVEEQLEGLRWLQMDWDEGPDVGGPFGPYVQTERLAIYQRYAQQLLDQGDAYRCYCSPERLEAMRQDQMARKVPPGYDRRCRDLSPAEEARLQAEGGAPVVRIKMPLTGTTTFTDALRGDLTFENALLDDFVGIKSDGIPTYNFANVIDDTLMEISHIFRGDEYISSTPRYMVLYGYLGFAPPVFVHTALVLGPDRGKLAKRHGATSVFEYRAQGYLPEALANYMALLGWSPGDGREILSRQELIAAFSLEGLQKSPAVFDIKKLEWMNGAYIRAMDVRELARRVAPFLVAAGLLEREPEGAALDYVAAVTALEQERLHRLAEAPAMMDFFFRDGLEYEPKGLNKWLNRPQARPLLDAVAAAMAAAEPWEPSVIEAAVREAGEQQGATGGQVIHPVRMAVTGRTTGPGLFDAITVLGRDRCVRRLRDAPA